MARREFEGLWRLVFFNGFGSSRISRAVAAEKLGRRRARARADTSDAIVIKIIYKSTLTSRYYI